MGNRFFWTPTIWTGTQANTCSPTTLRWSCRATTGITSPWLLRIISRRQSKAAWIAPLSGTMHSCKAYREVTPTNIFKVHDRWHHLKQSVFRALKTYLKEQERWRWPSARSRLGVPTLIVQSSQDRKSLFCLLSSRVSTRLIAVQPRPSRPEKLTSTPPWLYQKTIIAKW